MKKIQDSRHIHNRMPMVLIALLCLFVLVGCCNKYPVTAAGSQVSPGTIDENGNPAPAAARCTSGHICSNVGDGCGLINYQNHCVTSWDSQTGKCEPKCISN